MEDAESRRQVKAGTMTTEYGISTQHVILFSVCMITTAVSVMQGAGAVSNDRSMEYILPVSTGLYEVAIHANTEYDVSVVMEKISGNESSQYDIPGKTSLIIQFNCTIEADERNVTESVWRILSNDSVSVMLKPPFADAVSLYPTSKFETTFLVLNPSPEQPNMASILWLTAIEHNTTIEIMLPGNRTMEEFGVSNEDLIILNKYDILKLESWFDISGLYIKSNERIGVTVGLIDKNSSIGSSVSMSDMLPSTATWGQEFLSIPAIPGSAFTLYIIAQQNASLNIATGKKESTYQISQKRKLALSFENETYVVVNATENIIVLFKTSMIGENNTWFENMFFLQALNQYTPCLSFTVDGPCSEQCSVLLQRGIKSTDILLDGEVKSFAPISIENANFLIQKVDNISNGDHSICSQENSSTLCLFTLDRRRGSYQNDGTYYEYVAQYISRQTDDKQYTAHFDNTSSCCDNSTGSNSTEVKVENIQRMQGELSREVVEPPAPAPADENNYILAVVISLSSAVTGVFLVIGFFFFMELVVKRSQIRNTRIRPFVS